MNKTTEKPLWFEDEIRHYAKICSVSPEEAEKILWDKISEICHKHNCSLSEALEGYNLERCHRIDRDIFIETMMEEGMTREAAEAKADGCVIYF